MELCFVEVFELGLYNENLNLGGHELMKRFLELNYILGYSNLPLYKYRMHDNNRSKLPDIDKFDKKLMKMSKKLTFIAEIGMNYNSILV